MMKKFSKFYYSQLKQVKAGGASLLYKKIKRAVSLLYMTVAAPLSVQLKLDWPKAYEFMALGSMKKIKRLWLQPQQDKLQINRLLGETIAFLEKSIGQQVPDLSGFPDWIRKRIWLGDLHWIKNDIKESTLVHLKTVEIRRQIVESYQLDDLGMVFIPSVLAHGSIGLYEHLETYIKAGLLGMGPNKKMFLLLSPEVVVNNPCFLKYWSKYVTIISEPQMITQLKFLEGCLTETLVQFIYLDGNLCPSPFAHGIVRERWIQEKRPPVLSLSSEDQKRGWSTLRSLGMPEGAWFVSLHVREAGWKDEGSNQDDFRNADIRTYFLAIKAITDAGGWVVRIGDATMAKLPAMPQVIDYVHTPAKSDWMDIFLCSQCRFLIATSSGMSVVAQAFDVPLVVTNMLPVSAAGEFTSKDLFIPRLCTYKETDGYLNFQELMTPPVSTATSQTQYEVLNIKIKENLSEDLKSVVEEMLERFNKTGQYNEEDENLQEQFKSRALQCRRSYVDGDFDLAIHAKVGRDFLRKYSSLLGFGKSINVSNEVLKN